jgi:hypothetical protein
METTSVESAHVAAETAASDRATNEPATPNKSGSFVESASVESASVEAASVEAATIEARPAVETRSPISMEPRAGTYKDPANEPVRAIVAVGCAGIRGESVVAIRAYRSVTIAAANSNGHPNLRL